MNFYLLDNLLKCCQKPDDAIDENGISKQLAKAIIERALDAELTAYGGCLPHAAEGEILAIPETVHICQNKKAQLLRSAKQSSL